MVRDNKIAFDKLLNSSQNAITKYFNNLRLPGADKIICSRRLNTDFRHIISQYRENLIKINENFEEDTMGIYMTQLGHFMDSFYQEDQ